MKRDKPYNWGDDRVTCIGLVADIPSKERETITAGELINHLLKFKPDQPVYYQKRSGKLIPITYSEIWHDSRNDDPLGWLSARIKA